MKRMLSLFILATLSVALLSSCGSPALRYGSCSVDADIYDYLYASYKYVYVCEHKGIEDTEEGWQEEVRDGVTYEEDFHASFDVFVRSLVVASALYEADRRLSSDYQTARATVEARIDSLFYYESDSSPSALSACLAPYGTDYDGLYYTFLLLYRHDRLRTALFGDSGIGAVTSGDYADTVKAYYDENCIYVRYASLETDAIARDAADAAFDAVTSDEDFDAFIAAYSTSETKNGFFYRYDSYPDVDADVLFAVTRLSVGEQVSVAVDGTVYYIRRYPTGEEYKETANTGYFEQFYTDVSEICYREYLEDLTRDVETLSAEAKHPWQVTAPVDYNAVYHWLSY